MRISDWSSDGCSSDLGAGFLSWRGRNRPQRCRLAPADDRRMNGSPPARALLYQCLSAHFDPRPRRRKSMNLTDILQQAGGIESMAKELGVAPGVAQQGAEALLPAILGGFHKQAQGGGIEGLGGLIAGLGGGGLLDSVLGSQRSEEHTSELQSL